jgi:RNA polymerase sigma-32 factor
VEVNIDVEERPKPARRAAKGRKSDPAPARTKAAKDVGDDGAEDDDSDGEDELDDDSVIEATGEVIDERDLSSVELREEKEAKAEAKSLARVDALQMYMREVQRHPLLSPPDEHRLAVHYAKSGDVEAAAKL